MDATAAGIRRFLKAKYVIPLGFLGIAALAVILIWFQPQKLFIETRVDERAPGAATGDSLEKDTTGKSNESMPEGAKTTLAGPFRSIDHETSGTAILDKSDDGHYYVRLENFSTENGPDLFVYLSPAPSSSDGEAFVAGSIDLGELKGNIGSQNYLVPDGTDLSQYQSVVIWCRRFNVAFGAASLERT
jgi:hypothetical protein